MIIKVTLVRRFSLLKMTTHALVSSHRLDVSTALGLGATAKSGGEMFLLEYYLGFASTVVFFDPS